MIYTDCPRDLKGRVVMAIKCSFIGCRTDDERLAVCAAIVEFLTAMDFSAQEAVEVLQESDGSDIETDDVIDRMIAEFKNEAA